MTVEWAWCPRREKADGNVEVIAEEFPFKQFFSDAPCVLFGGQDFDQDLRAAEGCFCHIDQM